MLPGLGLTEIIALAVIALLVVGPKDLPLMMRKLGRWTGKMRAMAAEFRAGFDELAREAEMEELKREVEQLRRAKIVDVPVELVEPVDLSPIETAPVRSIEAQKPADRAAE